MKFTRIASYLLLSAVLIMPKAYAAAADAPVKADSLRALVEGWYPELFNGAGEVDLSLFEHEVAAKKADNPAVCFGRDDIALKALGGRENPEGNFNVDVGIKSGHFQLTILAENKIFIDPIAITTGSGDVYLSAASSYIQGGRKYDGNSLGTVVAHPGASIIHDGIGRVSSSYGPSAVVANFGDTVCMWG